MFVDNPVGLEVNGSLWSLGCEFDMYLMVLVLGVLRLIALAGVRRALASAWPASLFPGTLGFLGGWGWTLSFFAIGMVLYKLRDTRIFNGWLALLALAGLALSIPLRQFILLFPSSAAISRSISRCIRSCRSSARRASAISLTGSISSAGRRSRSRSGCCTATPHGGRSFCSRLCLPAASPSSPGTSSKSAR